METAVADTSGLFSPEVPPVGGNTIRTNSPDPLQFLLTSCSVYVPTVVMAERQIAYKLWLGTRTDFEDALYLYSLLEETLRTGDLERWVRELGVESDYERLARA